MTPSTHPFAAKRYAALELPDLQKTVQRAIAARLRQLHREAP